MKRSIIAVLALWAVFSAFGILLHHQTYKVEPPPPMNFVSVAGLDGEAYMNRFCNIHSIFRMRKRHPAGGIIMAPAYVIGSSVAQKAGLEASKHALIVFSAALAAITVWMLWLVVADLGAVAIWMSFAYVWLLASAPEFFSISQMILIGILLMMKKGVRDLRAWVAMVLLAGGTTITNFVKPMAAWGVLALHDRQIVQGLRIHAKKLIVGALVLFAVGVVVEISKWIWIDGMSVKEEVTTGYEYIAKWSVSAVGFDFGERMARTWEMFFCEPMMTHGVIFGVPRLHESRFDILPLGYRWALPHVVCATMLGLCIWSAWKNRRDMVVQALLAMISFDFMLHVVIGWGMPEAQIYCGHWLYAIPVLLAKLSGKAWKFVLAAVIMVWNVYSAIW